MGNSTINQDLFLDVKIEWLTGRSNFDPSMKEVNLDYVAYYRIERRLGVKGAYEFKRAMVDEGRAIERSNPYRLIFFDGVPLPTSWQEP